MQNYRSRINYVRANPVKRKMKVQTEDGPVTANPGDYVVINAAEKRTVLRKEFFEFVYEPDEDIVFCDICVDFDGVLHAYTSGAYTSGWQGAAIIADPPVEGAIEALHGYLSATPPLSVAIHSSRSVQKDGILSMRAWIDHHDAAIRRPDQAPIVDSLLFPFHKPAASVYLDDRGVRFDGTFPSVVEIRSLRVWNEKEKSRLILPE